MNLRFPDGTSYEGAAILEAKKRELGKHRIREIRIPQLRKISNNAKYPLLLLYDREPIASLLDENHPFARASGGWLRPTHGVRAAVVPLTAALASGRKDIWLYRFATSFAQQIATRYFNGLDLDPSPDVVAAVKGAATRLGVPAYVLAVTVLHGDIDGASPDIPPPDVNRDNLTPFGQS